MQPDTHIQEPTKTHAAKRVLQLMDSFEDGDSRYGEFVKLVSQEENISIEQLEKDLDPFI